MLYYESLNLQKYTSKHGYEITHLFDQNRNLNQNFSKNSQGLQKNESKIMECIQTTSNMLLQQARVLGFLDSKTTTVCSNCKVVFPNEYTSCPKCQIEIFYQTIRIEFEF